MISLLITLFIFNSQISRLDFVGNNSISSRLLHQEIISKKGDEYNEINLAFDIEKILHFYKTQGFFHTEVTPDVSFKGDSAEIVFMINEGPRPKIKKIIIDGAMEEEIKELFEIKINDFFIDEKIKITKDKIKNYYKNHGFAYADVKYILEPDSGIAIFTVEKDKLYYIRNIIIEGLKTCAPKVVRREIEIHRGDKFNKNKLTKSQRAIYSLGFFSTINVTMVKKEPDSLDLIFKLHELKSRILNFGIGLSIPLSFLFSFAIEELNIFNLGHRFQIRPAFKINLEKEWETKLEGRYIIPHVTPWRLTVSILPFLWYEEKLDFTRQTRGSEFRLSKLFSDNIIFSIANQYKYVILEPKITLPDTIKGITNSIKFQLMFDYRDDFFNPRKGIYMLPLIEYAGGIFGGANNFVKFEFECRAFQPFLGNTIAQRLKTGVIVPTDGMAIYEKYYLGGQYTLRGYPERSLGPEAIGDERYGDILGNYNFEYRINLPLNFGVVGFFDLGFVADKIDSEQKDFLKASAGAGLRYFTPIGPVRLDVGFPLMNKGREIYLGIYHIF
ncbi:MAG TPA: hypothetical protein ENI34_03955 [candidate division WOR-3 bacterium]|uniref:POTRA domain-containing protein n=1 Tax=candidate division WOR-3 bacterium TaxID=2052148 RepID=A0A9C9JZV1_UNCW3|nr:hypothetical protein [candidate division WOR-3 bacterium]